MKSKYNSFTDDKIDELIVDLFKTLDANPDMLFLYRVVNSTCGRDINVNDLYQLAERSEKFKKVWTTIKSELECRLAEHGAWRKTDSNFSWKCLSANYGWREKTEVTTVEHKSAEPKFCDDE